MAPYNHNYYDPAGSQNSQPSGYTYQTSTAPASQYPSSTASNYQNAGYQNYGNAYGSQQYGTNAQGTSNTTNQAASALSNLSSSTKYNQPSATSRTSNSGSYDSSTWGNNSYGSYSATNMAMPSRTQSNSSPLYATQSSSSTFGRLSVPEQTQTPSNSNTYAQQAHQNARSSTTPSNPSYQTAYSEPVPQTQTTQPQRYASPLHAVQAQQHQHIHPTQPSRGSAQPSAQPAIQPVQASNRQQSASVEPSGPTTVNPSQVYDDRAERQRKAQIDSEKRRKREEEEAAHKAEAERVAAAEKRKVEEEKQKAEIEKQEAAKRAQAERKAEARKKAREEKRQSKTAATALQKMSSSGGMDAPANNQAPPVRDEEAEMRAMFQKMREFNAKNPTMLAKLWEEERKSHTSPPTAKAMPAPPMKPPTPKQQQAASNATPSSAPPNGASEQQYRPFQKLPPPPKATPQSMTTSTQPMASPGNASLWPPQKKGSLAEAAAKWLISLPENTGKAVNREAILKILEANPSYVQLCEALEALGLRFERSLLARELLKAVPDGLKAPVPPPAASTPLSTFSGATPQANGSADSPRGKKRGRPAKVNDPGVGTESRALDGRSPRPDSRPMTNGGTVTYEAPSFSSLAEAAREVNNMGRAPPAPMSLQGGPVQPPQPSPYFMNGSRPTSQPQPQPPEKKPEVKPEAPRRPPANKEEAARKTFGDLVDLTADDSEDEGPPKKILQTANGQMNGASVQQPAPASVQFKHPMSFKDFYQQAPRPQPVMPGQGSMHPSAPAQAQMGAPKPLQPLPSNMPARPTQAPPPPLPQPVKPKGPSPEQLQQERIRGKMLVEPIMRDRVARKSKYDSRTIARDVLLATGRHPDMRALNAHFNTMQKLLGSHGGGFETSEGGRGDRSDLSTIRWHVVDPGSPPKPVVAKTVLGAATAVGGDETEDADDEDDNPAAPSEMPRHVSHQVVDNGDGTVRYVSVSQQLNGKTVGPKKRRGRPPRNSLPNNIGGERQHPSLEGQRDATNTRPSTNTPNRQSATTTAPQSAPAGSRPTAAAAASPSGADTPTGRPPVGYAAFRQVDEQGNVVKKKGRPVGWRKNVHSREAQGLAPATAGSATLPSRLRQSQNAEELLVEPEYRVWRCRWRGCKAELHNLEALKRHVVKIHGRPTVGSGRFECLWQGYEGSAKGVEVGKGKGKASEGDVGAMFGDLEGWVNHVDREHLRPVAWELGDGPRGGMSGTFFSISEIPGFVSFGTDL